MRQSPKLPSSVVAAPYDFEASPEFWDAIQGHTGELAHESKSMLTDAIEQYIYWSQYSENSQSLAGAQKRLSNFRSKVVALWDLLNSPREETGDPEMSINFALTQQTFYARQFAEPNRTRQRGLLRSLPPPVKFQLDLSLNLYAELMTELVIACDSAEKDLSQEKNEIFFDASKDWNTFVARLAAFYESIGRRATARKHTLTTTRGDVYSPFVAFVYLVQRQLPPSFCHHPRRQHTDGVQSELNSAVAKVLAARRKRAPKHQ